MAPDFVAKTRGELVKVHCSAQRSLDSPRRVV
jgi:hypothetical protein